MKLRFLIGLSLLLLSFVVPYKSFGSDVYRSESSEIDSRANELNFHNLFQRKYCSEPRQKLRQTTAEDRKLGRIWYGCRSTDNLEDKWDRGCRNLWWGDHEKSLQSAKKRSISKCQDYSKSKKNCVVVSCGGPMFDDGSNDGGYNWCDLHPRSPACGDSYCSDHPDSPICSGDSQYCLLHPEDPACQDP